MLLVGYPNGAVVPYNPYLHGYAGHYGHYLGKREAEADAGLLSYHAVPYHAVYQPLVAHPNGAVVPLEPTIWPPSMENERHLIVYCISGDGHLFYLKTIVKPNKNFKHQNIPHEN